VWSVVRNLTESEDSMAEWYEKLREESKKKREAKKLPRDVDVATVGVLLDKVKDSLGCEPARLTRENSVTEIDWAIEEGRFDLAYCRYCPKPLIDEFQRLLPHLFGVVPDFRVDWREVVLFEKKFLAALFVELVTDYGKYWKYFVKKKNLPIRAVIRAPEGVYAKHPDTEVMEDESDGEEGSL
jgi:hypothetical protein